MGGNDLGSRKGDMELRSKITKYSSIMGLTFVQRVDRLTKSPSACSNLFFSGAQKVEFNNSTFFR